MIPYRDDNPTYHTPWMTYGILGTNILIFLITLPGHDRWVFELGFIPWELFRGGTLPKSELMGGIASLFSSMFMHGGWLHLGGNMLFLWVFGNNVEDVMGGFRFLIFYLICGLFAHLAQIAHTFLVAGAPPLRPIPLEMIPYGIKMGMQEINWFIPVVGASGAISGVIAAYGRLFPGARIYTLVPIGIFITTVALPAFLIIVYWFLFQILSGLFAPSLGGGVAFWAHIGGFIGGWFIYPIFLRPEIRAHLTLRRRWRTLSRGGWI